MKAFGVSVLIAIVMSLLSVGLAHMFNLTVYEAITLLVAGMVAGMYGEELVD